MKTPPQAGRAPAGRWMGLRSQLQAGRLGFFLPFVLIALGVIAILLNFGWIPLGRLVLVFDLWPLLLVVAGLALVLRVLVSPPLARSLTLAAAVLALVAIVAYAVLGGPRPAADRQETGAGLVSTTASAALGSAASGRLQIEAGAAAIDIHQGAPASQLYQAALDFPPGHTPQLQVKGGKVVVRGRGDGRRTPSSSRPMASISLNSSIPWDVSIGDGASEDHLDLRGLDLRSLTVDSGASHLSLQLPRPKGTVRVEISGGATDLEITRPAGVPVQSTISGGASNLTFDLNHMATLGGGGPSGGVQKSADYDAAANRYDIGITGGANNLTIRED